MNDICPYSNMKVSLDTAYDPGAGKHLRIVCSYCGRDVAINWTADTLRKHRRPEAALETEYDEKLWASLPEAPPLVPKE